MQFLRGAGARMQSEAVEKYLKTIYEIQPPGGRVKTTTLAQTLGVTAGSVTDMIKRLSIKIFAQQIQAEFSVTHTFIKFFPKE